MHATHHNAKKIGENSNGGEMRGPTTVHPSPEIILQTAETDKRTKYRLQKKDATLDYLLLD